MTRKSEVPDRIVHGAVVLFSRQGYHGTSTREIARLAQVSEVTIYRYFEGKEDIFQAALESSFSSIKPHLRLLPPTSKYEAPEVMIPRIVGLLRDTVSLSPELVWLILVAFLEVHGDSEKICREHLAQLLTAIDDYLKTHIQAGRIRNVNSAIVTVAMAMSVFVQPEISRIIGWSQFQALNSRQILNEYSAFWVNALISPSREHTQYTEPAVGISAA
jgi:AcrR family transcriptional regulator